MTVPSPQQQLHFVLIPLMAQGHTIPMIEIAQLLAERGVLATVVTTPVNASRLSVVIDRLTASALPIRFAVIRFPCAETGLPDGCENLDLLPSMHLFPNFFAAAALLRHPLESHLRDQQLRPSCIISDAIFPWTSEIARELRIPRLVFHGPSCFTLLVYHNIRHHKIYQNIAGGDESKPFPVPGMPHRIETTRAHAPGFFNLPGWEKLRDEMIKTELAADGVMLNSFDGLETQYIDSYREALGINVWAIGPLSLCNNKDVAGKAARGNKATVDESRLLSWLDSMEERSVVYVCFGSLAYTCASQLIEIGLGLEASGRPFIWVIKEKETSPEVEAWLAAGFEERTSARSLVIKGWAPQAVIITHPAVGGFMTHCGWNSVLEGVSAGAPMITWPHFADQFLNEKLMVEVLKIGVAVGARAPVSYVDTAKDEARVGRDQVEKAVRSLMDGGEEGEERRKRVRKLGEEARKAMEEGGSSNDNMSLVIKHVSHVLTRMLKVEEP